MRVPLIALANDIDVTAWCAWAAPQAWRNKRGAVEILVRYYPLSSRPLLLAVRTHAHHVQGEDKFLQLLFRAEVLYGANPYKMARGYVRLITTLMGVDRKEVFYDGFEPQRRVARKGSASDAA